MFNRFKEKLSGFKEALSSKIAEKVSAAGLKAEPKSGEDELKAHEARAIETSAEKSPDKSPVTSPVKSPDKKSKQKAESLRSGSSVTQVLPSEKGEATKPKSRFSFLEKAKSLVFEQEIILEEKDLDEPMWQLEMALMESDVALPVAEEIVREVKSDLVGKRKKIGADTGKLAEDSLRKALISLLSKNYLDFDEYIKTKDKPIKILFVGVNGTGKTTSIAKVAKYLMDHSYSVVLAAGDTFRAGAIEQLEVHGDQSGFEGCQAQDRRRSGGCYLRRH